MEAAYQKISGAPLENSKDTPLDWKGTTWQAECVNNKLPWVNLADA